MAYNFTERVQTVLTQAVSLVKSNGNPELTSAHILYTVFKNDEEIAVKALGVLGLKSSDLATAFEKPLSDLPKVSGGAEPTTGSFAVALLEEAEKVKTDWQDSFLSVEHLIVSGARSKQPSVVAVYKKFSLTFENLSAAIKKVRGNNKVVDQTPENKLGVLEKYAKDLTQLAKDNKLDPVIGRDDEVRRVIQILSRRTKNNPVLIGEPGVGKTAIAEGLAQRIVRGDVPETLKDRQLLALDIASIIAGAKYRGEFEERLKAVLKEVQDAAGQIILFIDEIHTIVKAGGAEGAMDAGNMLKPALARGELRCVGATTLDEYRIIEKDPALERRFQPVLVQPPSVADTITILRGLKERYEIHHRVRIKDNALIAAATLSDRYIADRFLPDKAIDLIDEAASRLKIQLDSVPEALDSTERKIGQLKMELAAISREQDAQTQDRARAMENQIKELEAEAKTLRDQWQAAKGAVKEVSELKKAIEEARARMEQFERRAEYAKASEIKFGELPRLEQLLKEKTGQSPSTRNPEDTTLSVKEEVDAEDVAAVVSHWTGIPINKLFSAERDKLLNLEDELRSSVVGQDHALESVADAIRLSRSGLKDPSRPLGSFLFLGPTGVGKTETAKALARSLFESDKAMIRMDMSEFMEEHSVSKLIGSPPGYVGFDDGGQLTEAVRRKPYCVVLFDEIEKAHPKVLNVLLQMLDDGRLTDSKGRLVSFSNAVIIMTSNIGASEILQAQSEGQNYEALKNTITNELLKFIRPELLNRIEDTVVFKPLTPAVLNSIVNIQIHHLQKRLEQQDIFLKVENAVVTEIAQAGWDVHFGARPLRRAVQNILEVPLSKLLLKGKFAPKDTILAYWDGGGCGFKKENESQ